MQIFRLPRLARKVFIPTHRDHFKTKIASVGRQSLESKVCKCSTARSLVTKISIMVQPVPPVIFPTSSTDKVDQDSQWVAGLIRCWLDEEWTPLEVHKSLGKAAGVSYRAQRLTGKNEATDILLGMTTDLLSYDYRDAFVNGWDISNKVLELLMLRQGIDVCCISESDRCAIARYERLLEGEQSSE